MILINNPIFSDPLNDKTLPVIEIIDNVKDIQLDENHFYLVDGLVYEFVDNPSINNIKPGTIFKINNTPYIEAHLPQNEEFYDEKLITSKEAYINRIKVDTLEEMVRKYSRNYKEKNNLIVAGNVKITPSGEIYMPELDSDDDPLERVTKLMLRHMKLVLNDFRGSFSKKHGLDNIKSALNGATKNMSIVKFISWCNTLELEWEIGFNNTSSDVMNPLRKPIILTSKTEYPWADIPPETKNCFTVPLEVNEDPLKRGVKLVLNDKRIDMRDYRHRSPTPHLLNNMKSALKSKQKMTLPYCLNWCEIIDISISFKLINPRDGIWYKMTGYDMTTNDNEIS